MTKQENPGCVVPPRWRRIGRLSSMVGGVVFVAALSGGCERRGLALDEAVALCSVRSTELGGRIAIAPTKGGSVPRGVGEVEVTWFDARGRSVPMAATKGGCYLVPKEHGVVLARARGARATGKATGEGVKEGPLGGLLVISPSSATGIVPLRMGPIANEEAFLECGIDARVGERTVKVVRANGNGLLASQIAAKSRRSHGTWAPDGSVAVTPLGCLRGSEGKTLVLSALGTDEHIFIPARESDKRIVAMLPFPSRETFEKCEGNPTGRVSEALLGGGHVAVALRSAGVSSESLTSSSYCRPDSRGLCGGWTATQKEPEKGAVASFGRCAVAPADGTSYRIRLDSSNVSKPEAVVASLLPEDLRSAAKSRAVLEVTASRFLSAEEIARGLRVSFPQCKAGSVSGVALLNEKGRFVAEVGEDDPSSPVLGAIARVDAMFRAGDAAEKGSRWPLDATGTTRDRTRFEAHVVSLSRDAASAWSDLLAGSSLAPVIEVVDLQGRSAAVRRVESCVLRLEAPSKEVPTGRLTSLSTTHDLNSILRLGDVYSDLLRNGAQLAIRWGETIDGSSEEAGAEGAIFDTQDECLRSGGFTPLSGAVVPLEEVGRRNLVVKACSPAGALILVESKRIHVDGKKPEFFLMPAEENLAPVLAASTRTGAITVRENLTQFTKRAVLRGFYEKPRIRIGGLKDDILSIEEMLAGARCSVGIGNAGESDRFDARCVVSNSTDVLGYHTVQFDEIEGSRGSGVFEKFDWRVAWREGKTILLNLEIPTGDERDPWMANHVAFSIADVPSGPFRDAGVGFDKDDLRRSTFSSGRRILATGVGPHDSLWVLTSNLGVWTLGSLDSVWSEWGSAEGDPAEFTAEPWRRAADERDGSELEEELATAISLGDGSLGFLPTIHPVSLWSFIGRKGHAFSSRLRKFLICREGRCSQAGVAPSSGKLQDVYFSRDKWVEVYTDRVEFADLSGRRVTLPRPDSLPYRRAVPGCEPTIDTAYRIWPGCLDFGGRSEYLYDIRKGEFVSIESLFPGQELLPKRAMLVQGSTWEPESPLGFVDRRKICTIEAERAHCKDKSELPGAWPIRFGSVEVEAQVIGDAFQILLFGTVDGDKSVLYGELRSSRPSELREIDSWSVKPALRIPLGAREFRFWPPLLETDIRPAVRFKSEGKVRTTIFADKNLKWKGRKVYSSVWFLPMVSDAEGVYPAYFSDERGSMGLESIAVPPSFQSRFFSRWGAVRQGADPQLLDCLEVNHWPTAECSSILAGESQLPPIAFEEHSKPGMPYQTGHVTLLRPDLVPVRVNSSVEWTSSSPEFRDGQWTIAAGTDVVIIEDGFVVLAGKDENAGKFRQLELTEGKPSMRDARVIKARLSEGSECSTCDHVAVLLLSPTRGPYVLDLALDVSSVREILSIESQKPIKIEAWEGSEGSLVRIGSHFGYLEWDEESGDVKAFQYPEHLAGEFSSGEHAACGGGVRFDSTCTGLAGRSQLGMTPLQRLLSADDDVDWISISRQEGDMRKVSATFIGAFHRRR